MAQMTLREPGRFKDPVSLAGDLYVTLQACERAVPRRRLSAPALARAGR